MQGHQGECREPYTWELTDSFRPKNISVRQKEEVFVNENNVRVENFKNSTFVFEKIDLLRVFEEDITLHDSESFVAGNLHTYADRWQNIIQDENDQVLKWINQKVDIHDFMVPYKGTFWGVRYDHSYPPSRHFKNASICKDFVPFINSELTKWLESGAISYLGKVGEINPPYITNGITIEPNKPRLCLNLMYLNCFMKDTPFSLDTLADVPHLIQKGEYMTKLDDYSGYLHILMTDRSRPLLGFQWGGHYFCANALVFGWKNAAYVYHTTNLKVMSYLRKIFITGLIYIDDRLLGSFNNTVPSILDNPFARASIAIKLSVKLLVSLGYYLGVKKCIFIPCQDIVFLGMIVDSVQCSFFITEKRRQKFICLRESILGKTVVPLVDIQRFCGLSMSMALALPAAKLYTSCCNRAISKASNGSGMVRIDAELRTELIHWRFIDSWSEPFPWLMDRHSTISLSSDSSDYKWGACFTDNGEQLVLSDYWTDDQNGLPIMLKEALALKNTLLSLGDRLRNKRIQAFVDSKAVCGAWSNQYSKSPELNVILKDIFQIIFSLNCTLTLTYIPSSQNPSDEPSRALSKSDAMLSRRAWWYLEQLFGPHSVDMFSLDSNSMTDKEGKTLKHFTPYPSPQSNGADAFAQRYRPDDNCYAHPPFCLIPAAVKFIIQENISCSLLFPDVQPHPAWFSLLYRFARTVVPIGLKGDKGVILYPSRKGYISDKVGLKWDLLAARFSAVPSSPSRISLLSQSASPNFTPVLLLGDSMVRFIQGQHQHVYVVFIGGARLHDFSHEFLCHHILSTKPCLVLIHIGTNDINKSTLPIEVSLQYISKGTCNMFQSLSNLQDKYSFAVGISGCIYTKSGDINKKVDVLNSLFRSKVNEFKFRYIDNSNIHSSHLRDFVHLNSDGETVFKQNLKGLI